MRGRQVGFKVFGVNGAKGKWEHLNRLRRGGREVIEVSVRVGEGDRCVWGRERGM